MCNCNSKPAGYETGDSREGFKTVEGVASPKGLREDFVIIVGTCAVIAVVLIAMLFGLPTRY